MIKCEVKYNPSPLRKEQYIMVKPLDNDEYCFAMAVYDENGRVIDFPKIGQIVYIYNSILTIEAYDLMRIQRIRV